LSIVHKQTSDVKHINGKHVGRCNLPVESFTSLHSDTSWFQMI